VKTAFGLKTAPDCRIYRPERMSASPDHMAACTNPTAGWKSGCSGFQGFAADGFGLSVHEPAAQTTRDVIFTRDTRRRPASADGAVAKSESYRLSAFQSEKTWQRKS
jgi:hypothetical protein